MWHLATRMAVRRIASLIAVACAVFGGAALVTGTAVLAESGVRSQVPAGRLAGAEVVVASDQTFPVPEGVAVTLPERGGVPADLVARLAEVPGVTRAFADVTFPAAVLGEGGRVVPTANPKTGGHGWSSTAFVQHHLEVDGTAPKGPGEVAVDRAIARAADVGPGDDVSVVAAGRTSTYRVTAVVAGDLAGVLFDDSTATDLAAADSGRSADTVALIGLHTEADDASSVAAAVERLVGDDGLTVSTGADRGAVVAPELAGAGSLLLLLASSLAGVIVVIVGFVVAGALAVSLTGQRRELALLRAVGATPRQIRHLAAGQATVIAVVALVPGIGLGYLLAGRFRTLLVDIGLLPDVLPLTFSVLPALVTALLFPLVVQVAARAITWRTSRMPATEAVAESRSEARNPSSIRTGVGLLMIVAATALSVVPLLARTQLSAASTSMAGILAAVGLAVAGPGLVRQLGNLLAKRVAKDVAPPTWLAMRNIHAYPLRLAGAVTTLAMAVVFTLTYVLSQTTVMGALSQDVESGTRAQVSITASALGGIPEGLVTDVREVPGVLSASAVSTTTVLWPHRALGAEEVESGPAMVLASSAGDVLDLGVREGSLARLTGNTIAVGENVASSRDADVGSDVDLVLGDGSRVTARVVAVYARSLGFGPVVLSRDLVAGHTTSGLAQTVLVRTDGTDAAQEGPAALAASRPGLSVDGPNGGGTTQGSVPAEMWVNLATIVVLLGYLLLAIANSLVATTLQRRGEIATLRLTGTTPGQVRSMMRRESVFVGVTAAVSGLVLSAIPLAFLGIGFLGRPWPAGPVWLVPATLLTVAGIAFATVEIPTRHLLRSSPAQAVDS